MNLSRSEYFLRPLLDLNDKRLLLIVFLFSGDRNVELLAEEEQFLIERNHYAVTLYDEEECPVEHALYWIFNPDLLYYLADVSVFPKTDVDEFLLDGEDFDPDGGGLDLWPFLWLKEGVVDVPELRLEVK